MIDGDTQLDGSAANGAVFNVFLRFDGAVDDYLNALPAVGTRYWDYF